MVYGLKRVSNYSSILKNNLIYIDKKTQPALIMQKIKQYCIKHNVVLTSAELNEKMQHAKKHGWYAVKYSYIKYKCN